MLCKLLRCLKCVLTLVKVPSAGDFGSRDTDHSGLPSEMGAAPDDGVNRQR